MVIDWATDLAAIAGDTAPIALVLSAKVTTLGQLYDANGHPDVMTEGATHIAWRAALTSQLSARDRTAASVDGLATATIDPANPNASARAVSARLAAAALVASGAVGELIADMLKSSLPAEPQLWVSAYYAPAHVSIGSATGPAYSFQAVGDIQAALLDALSELSAYIAYR